MKEKTFPTSVRLTEKEKLILKALVEHFRKTSVGDVSENDVMRLALKRLAEAEGVKQMETYKIDLSNLSEEEKGDVSQRLHELQETCLDVKDNVGRVYGVPATVGILQSEGHAVNLVRE